jgi:hypothetical protein
MDESEMREPRNGGSGVAWVSRYLQCGPGQTLFNCCQACGLRSPGSHVAGNGNGGEENLHTQLPADSEEQAIDLENHEALNPRSGKSVVRLWLCPDRGRQLHRL